MYKSKFNGVMRILLYVYRSILIDSERSEERINFALIFFVFFCFCGNTFGVKGTGINRPELVL